MLLLMTLFFSAIAVAQAVDRRGDLLPGFQMTKTSGKIFESRQLKNERPVLLIYFAPDCDHCLVLLDAFFKKTAAFKNAEIVLISFKPVQQLLPFEKKYGTAQHANMHVGTEGWSFYLRNHYRLQKTPFVALYDKQKKLVCSFRETPSLTEIIACFKTIQ
jgi:hypothetical protein